MNHADSKRIEEIIESMGYTKTEDEDRASILGIIACSVRQKAVDRVLSRIKKWNLRKQNENLLTFVSGCFLKEEEKKYLKLFDIVIKTEDTPKLPTIISEYGVNFPILNASAIQKKVNPIQKNIANDNIKEIQSVISNSNSDIKQEVSAMLSKFRGDNNEIDEFWKTKPKYDSEVEGFIPIQNGCDKFCSFCAVPYTRGRERSRESSDVIKEFEEMLETGVKTITLLGQNVNSYGKDKKDELNFTELLEKIGEIADASGRKVWVYFTSPHPKDFDFKVIDVIAKYKSLAKQIHLPMQSGDDKLLFRMNRNHSMKRYSLLIEKIRSAMPRASIFTDIIVGFSQESEIQFKNTKKAMEKFQFDMAYIAVYSKRPGALSFRWKDDVPHEEKKRRHAVLSEVLKEGAMKQHEYLIGKIIDVLVLKKSKKGFFEGYSEGRINVVLQGDCVQIGDFAKARVISLNGLSLECELIN